MGTVDPRKAVAAALGVLLLVMAGVIAWHLRPVPQMKADEKVFKTVDALYTAVRNRDEAAVARCEAKLAEDRAAGKLGESAADYLERIIAKAKGGGWDAAAEKLYDFMRAQRRN